MKCIFLSLLVAVSISSCSPKIAADRYWSGKRWVLVELKGVPVQLSGTNRDAFIEFNDNDKTISGNGGCNRMSGPYTLEKTKLSFGELMTTKMSCPDIAFETTLMEELRKVDHYSMDNDLLVFKDGNKTLMKLRQKY